MLFVVVISVFEVDRKYEKQEEKSEMKLNSIMVGNVFATYENIDRELDIEYFYDLNCNTTYQEIENEIGKPNGGMGSGLVRPYYQVGDQYVVMDFTLNEEGNYDRLSGMSLYTKEKYVDDIPFK